MRRSILRIQIVEDDKALNDGIRLALQEPEFIFLQSVNIQQAKKDFEQQKPEFN